MHAPQALDWSTMTDHIFREVDEEVRRERLKRLWDRYGLYILGVALLVVLFTAGYRGWEAWTAGRAAAAGDDFLQAVDYAETGDVEAALASFQTLAAEGPNAYPVLARLRAAAVLGDAGRLDEAVAEYDAVAAAGTEPALQDLARLRAGLLLVDRMSLEEAKFRLERLAVAEAPYRHSAREAIALVAYRTGAYEEAERWFRELIADPQAPQGARARADVMMQLIAGTAPSPAEETKP
jgi:hypothetical protein